MLRTLLNATDNVYILVYFVSEIMKILCRYSYVLGGPYKSFIKY